MVLWSCVGPWLRERHTTSFQSSGQVKILVPPCLHLFGWPVLFALWDRRVETAVFYCHWNFCLIAKHHGLLFVEVIPLCWPGKSSAAAFYKIPEVVVIWANPGFEIGKDCFHHPYFKPTCLSSLCDIFASPSPSFLQFPGSVPVLPWWIVGTDCRIRRGHEHFRET